MGINHDLPSSSSSSTNSNGADRTVVLVGRTGNGKSATANSILGTKSFISKTSSSGVTITTQLQYTQFPDGQILNVIDTPGLFDSSLKHDFIGNEIVKCLQMANAGIHAFLLVFSARVRFSKEEDTTIQSLKDLFGEKILDYMILVFTGGDGFEDHDIGTHEKSPFEDYLGLDCPRSLHEILHVCKNRRFLFDNKTKDADKQSQQRRNLLAMVEELVDLNGGQTYTIQMFEDFQSARKRVPDIDSVNSIDEGDKFEHMQQLFEKQLKETTHQLELKVKEKNMMLQIKLEKEKKARLKAVEKAKADRIESERNVHLMRENLARAHREAEAARNQFGCTIC